MTRALVVGALSLLSCAHAPPLVDPVPPHESFELESAALGERRRINVLLPPGYDGVTAFDVVFMPDGGLDEDFPHVANTLLALMASGDIKPVVLVGIPNTVRRRDLTAPTAVASDREVAPVVGGSPKFRQFLRDELVPAIAAKYRVTTRRTLVGESLAGHFVVECFFFERATFDGFVAISPSLWWNDHELVREAGARLATPAPRAGALFLTAANETDIAPFAAQLATTLETAKGPALALHYEPHPELRHDTIFRGTERAGLRFVLRALAGDAP